MTRAFLALAGGWYLILRRIESWFRRRFTTAGGCLLLALIVSLGTADHEQTQGLGMFLVMLAALVLGMALALLFRPRLRIVRTLPRLVTAGVPFRIELVVGNPGRRPVAGIAYLEDFRRPVLSGAEAFALLVAGRQGGPGRTIRAARAEIVELPDIPPGGEITLSAEVTAWRRGMLETRGGLLLRADPLGFFRAVRRWRSPGNVLVLPPRYPLPPLLRGGLGGNPPEGTAITQDAQGQEDFAALRDYRRGDPLKLIHWRSAARTGRLVVRECEDIRPPRLGLILDLGCPANEDRLFAEAVAVAASFACTLADGSSRIDLLVLGDRAIVGRAGSDPQAARPMLEALATVQPDRHLGLAALNGSLTRLGGGTAQGIGAWVVVATRWDDDHRGLQAQLGTSGAATLVLLVRAPEAPAVTDPGVVVLTAGRVAEDLARLEEGP